MRPQMIWHGFSVRGRMRWRLASINSFARTSCFFKTIRRKLHRSYRPGDAAIHGAQLAAASLIRESGFGEVVEYAQP
ncbi:hypothetical protein PYCCODRAFT_239918 [Trametes coccinea BRFM310]|uniref:Uncharacterized protein n=1 Tax=Trametes coccinea (strain BRFM310) TaxID=1353009 RepID=A0A1Y2IR79_TRAC3|nr:hypothetical protein PYCCODRAFT_239918 [Trametes coccinea BRFM310]